MSDTGQEPPSYAGLAYLAASQAGYADAKRIVVAAAHDLLDTIKYSGPLRARLDDVATLLDPVAAAREIAEFAPSFVALVSAKTEEVGQDVFDALDVVAARYDDPESIGKAWSAVAVSAEDALVVGVACARRAQVTACAWGMAARCERPLGHPALGPNEVDLIAATRRIAAALLKNFDNGEGDRRGDIEGRDVVEKSRDDRSGFPSLEFMEPAGRG